MSLLGSTARVWPLAVHSSKANAAWICLCSPSKRGGKFSLASWRARKCAAKPVSEWERQYLSGKWSESVREWLSESTHCICSTFWARFYLILFGVSCLEVHWVLLSSPRPWARPKACLGQFIACRMHWMLVGGHIVTVILSVDAADSQFLFGNSKVKSWRRKTWS